MNKIGKRVKVVRIVTKITPQKMLGVEATVKNVFKTKNDKYIYECETDNGTIFHSHDADLGKFVCQIDQD